MTEEEKKKFESLALQVRALVERLDKATEKVYHYTQELPDFARPTIQKLLDKGIYAGSSEADLNLPESLMRMLVINDRTGIYE